MKKYICSFLIFTILLQLFGCYSSTIISKDEYFNKAMIKDIYLNLSNGDEMYLEYSEYFIKGDTLYWRLNENQAGSYISTGKIPLNNIVSIEYEEYDSTKTTIALVLPIILVGVLIFTFIAISEVNYDFD